MERELQSDDPAVVAAALYSAARFSIETEWVEGQCLARLSSKELVVRWAAAVCLGELAFFRGPIDVPRVVRELEAAAIEHPDIAGPVRESVDWIREFAE